MMKINLDDMKWQWKHFEALTPYEVYDLAALREQVFIFEQKCGAEELDYLDQTAEHLLGYYGEHLVAYLRVFTNKPEHTVIGRLVTHPDARAVGLGKLLTSKAIEHLQTLAPEKPIMLHAQKYLINFYKGFGFQEDGGYFDEGGIKHVKMVRTP